MAHIGCGIRYLFVGPANGHELAIARIVDRIDMEGTLAPSAIDEIIAALTFIPSEADSDFLVHFIRWRMANPIPK